MVHFFVLPEQLFFSVGDCPVEKGFAVLPRDLPDRFGTAPLLEAYTAAAVDLAGHAVRVTGGARHVSTGSEPTGRTAGLGADGALHVIPDDGGEVLIIRYGEVLRLEEP